MHAKNTIHLHGPDRCKSLRVCHISSKNGLTSFLGISSFPHFSQDKGYPGQSGKWFCTNNIWLMTNYFTLIWFNYTKCSNTCPFSAQKIVNWVPQQTSMLFHKTSSAQKVQGMVLFGQSSFKCFFRSFLWNSFPQFLGQDTSTKSHSFKWS